jgi:hypothetical protein
LSGLASGRPNTPAPPATPARGAAPVTLTTFATTYLARVSAVRERNKSWTNDRHMFAQLARFALRDGSRLGAWQRRTEHDAERVDKLGLAHRHAPVAQRIAHPPPKRDMIQGQSQPTSVKRGRLSFSQARHG